MRIAAAIVLLAAPLAGARGEPCVTAEGCDADFPLSSGRSIHYYRTIPLVLNEAVTRAVIVVHGNRRDADRYYDHIVAAATAEDRLHDAALLAPHFRTLEDHPGPNEHYWSSHGWKIGHKSKDASRFSSFAVMNEMLSKICSSESLVFPRLETVVIIGHSAGGQFVNRYLAGGAGCPKRDVEVRYVVMNPSSYLYVDGRRKSTETGGFEIPKPDCPGYDDYKYGLRDLNSYMKAVGTERLRSRLFERKSYYLAGEEDDRQRGSFDARCQANLQGPHRLARHRIYRDYAVSFDDWTGARFSTVPGVGHSGGKMLKSETARRITFR